VQKFLKNIGKKLVFALFTSMLLAMLGIFKGVGYRVFVIEETTFVPHTRLGYADVKFYFEGIFNPLLYPYYWIRNYGIINSDFYFLYRAEHPHWLMDTMSGGLNMEVDSDWYPWGWELTPEERCETYEIYLLTLGNVANFFVLFIVTLFIEILNMRKLYIAIFAGIVGFAFGNLTGTVAGMVVGLFLFILCFKLPKLNGFLNNLWFQLWEKY